MYSAVKHEGKRLYDLARAGVEVEREPREVVVHRIALREWSPPKAAIEVDCGKGFYMRGLAHDLGAAVGCPAHLSALTRSRVGPFTLDDAITPRRTGGGGGLGSAARAARRRAPADGCAAAPSGGGAPRSQRAGRNAGPRWLPYAKHLEVRRAYAEGGRFLGVVRFNRAESSWQPEKMLAKPIVSRYAPEG